MNQFHMTNGPELVDKSTNELKDLLNSLMKAQSIIIFFSVSKYLILSKINTFDYSS